MSKAMLLGIVLALSLGLALAHAEPPPKPAIGAAAGTLRVETVASGLGYPWSLVFLPDGSMLVSEKHPGRLRRVSLDGTISEPIRGLPPIHAKDNGGLLGLALDPGFARNGRVYFAYSEPGDGRTARLSVARATLGETELTDVEIIFRQRPDVADAVNFGGRLVFAPDGTLFVLTGDRFALDLVQDRSNTIGTVVRIEPDGSVPSDNPFAGQPGAAPEIWSLGHRNIGGGAIHPRTGQLWIGELGPWGGDELNIAEPGRNYGWPLVSWGRHYEGGAIPDPTTRPHLARSIFNWNPVISPSGMAFYDGEAIPAWQGSLLMGGLSSAALIRLTLEDDRVIGEERLETGFRVRDVVQGPDGAVYLLSDEPEGEIYRVTLVEPAGGSD